MLSVLDRSFQISRRSEVLTEIRRDDCNLVIWQRPALSECSELLLGSPRNIRFTTPLGNLATRLSVELDSNGFEAAPIRDELTCDIVELSDIFCSIMTLDAVEVRLEVVTTDSCRKFHADYVSARLISTYIGSGTQWLETSDADRVAQGLEPLSINNMGAGDVGLFKGRLTTEAPAIHRSPPIAGTGETRLLLVLNPAKGH